MNKNNKLRLTWISFFSYGLTGALVIVTSVVLGNIADYFQLPVSSMSNTFTFLNSGILAAIFLNAWLMEIIPLKQQLMFGFLLMMLAVLGLMSGHNLMVFSLSMFVLGAVSGITMSIGTYLITHLYAGRQRGSCLLFTDSFFSMAGTLFPMLAGVLLARHITWYWVYACIGMVYVMIFVLTLLSDFPVLKSRAASIVCQTLQTRENWGPGVALLALAALCYILGQLSFISWVPEYATTRFQMNIQQAGGLVSYFWTAYMVGMWVFSALLRFFDLQRIVTLLAALSAAFMYLFIHVDNPTWLPWCLLALGFVSSAIYTTIITLGSQQTRVTSPRLVNFILTCGTIGTMLTFIVTGPIVAHYGVSAALQTSNLLYVTVFVLCLLLGFVSRHRTHSQTIV
ncbi:transporter [Sodalis-like endosymbiont of Proechinophthirus fluctus]|uniref:MFS transporter TsgA n=1 Tax=Sodalis-like endosymbiont of Proechinophthirus fluctus TaxID=1462730 RepID=UPI0007A8175B|nr:MFS transporter TsgA [Sodalis-like endosymbiont of Proechinophthirus fluctus]KYP97550.1 transporter [Sodalis-like endosymbiont of Proechinophthirus fluctus]